MRAARATWVVAALALCLPLAVLAQEYRELNVKKGRLAGDQYLAGTTVDVHGSVEGDLTMAALQAGLDGTVSGDVNAAGLLVHVGGVVGDDVRALGGKVIVQGWVGDGLLVAGGEISLTRGTRVGGNAILGGRRIVDLGDVAGNLDAAGAYVEIDGDVTGVARIRSDDVVIGPRARLRGDLVVTGARPPRIADGAVVGGKVTVVAPSPRTLGAWVVAAARAALMQIGMLLLAWAWLALAPGLARDAVAMEWRSPWFAETLGIAAVFGLPLASVLLALTVVGIPVAIGTGFRLDPPRAGRLLLDGALPGGLASTQDEAPGGFPAPGGAAALDAFGAAPAAAGRGTAVGRLGGDGGFGPGRSRRGGARGPAGSRARARQPCTARPSLRMKSISGASRGPRAAAARSSRSCPALAGEKSTTSTCGLVRQNR